MLLGWQVMYLTWGWGFSWSSKGLGRVWVDTWVRVWNGCGRTPGLGFGTGVGGHLD